MNYKMRVLGTKPWVEIAQDFANLPVGVTTLDLSKNDLGSKSGDELAQILAEIPDGVSTLNLGWNNFDTKSVNELFQAFKAIPPGVNTLSLSGNFLYRKSGTELSEIFTAIPAVTTLDLSDNGFWRNTIEELTLIVNAIPNHVMRLCFSVQEFNDMSEEQRQIIHVRYPHAEQIILIDVDDNARQLNPVLNKEDARMYLDLGFKISPKSLFQSASFFIGLNREKLQKLVPDFEQKLYPGLLDGIKRFGG